MKGLRKPFGYAGGNLGFFWRQQHAAEVGRTLDFAERAAIGANVEVQKQEV